MHECGWVISAADLAAVLCLIGQSSVNEASRWRHLAGNAVVVVMIGGLLPFLCPWGLVRTHNPKERTEWDVEAASGPESWRCSCGLTCRAWMRVCWMDTANRAESAGQTPDRSYWSHPEPDRRSTPEYDMLENNTVRMNPTQPVKNTSGSYFTPKTKSKENIAS